MIAAVDATLGRVRVGRSLPAGGVRGHAGARCAWIWIYRYIRPPPRPPPGSLTGKPSQPALICRSEHAGRFGVRIPGALTRPAIRENGGNAAAFCSRRPRRKTLAPPPAPFFCGIQTLAKGGRQCRNPALAFFHNPTPPRTANLLAEPPTVPPRWPSCQTKPPS